MDWITNNIAILLPLAGLIGGAIGWTYRNRRDDMSAIIGGFRELRELTEDELDKTIHQRDDALTDGDAWREQCEYCKAHLEQLFEIIDHLLDAAEKNHADWPALIVTTREKVERLKEDRQRHEQSLSDT